MRELITNLALFFVFAVAFSGLTSCTDPQMASKDEAEKPANAANRPSGSKSSLYPPVSTGLTEASFELLDGKTTKLDDYKGKVVMMNLWGIWCGPCRDEMPHLMEMQQQYGQRGFEVIGLNVGDNNGAPETVEAIQKFAGQMKINYTLARMDRTAIRQFHLTTKQEVVPQTILVDREGHLRGVFVGGGPKIYESMKTTLEKTMLEQ
jgi:thiol-disulfide isomerase/thioredoxin